MRTPSCRGRPAGAQVAPIGPDLGQFGWCFHVSAFREAIDSPEGEHSDPEAPLIIVLTLVAVVEVPVGRINSVVPGELFTRSSSNLGALLGHRSCFGQ